MILDDIAETIFPGEQQPGAPDKKWGLLELAILILLVVWGGVLR